MQNLINNFLNVVLNNYFNPNGRASRYEFWMFFAANLLIGVILGILTTLIGSFFSIIDSLYSLAVLLPSVCLGIRRLHDTNRSGWYLLLSLIPVVGSILVIVFMATSGTPGENDYGPAV